MHTLFEKLAESIIVFSTQNMNSKVNVWIHVFSIGLPTRWQLYFRGSSFDQAMIFGDLWNLDFNKIYSTHYRLVPKDLSGTRFEFFGIISVLV